MCHSETTHSLMPSVGVTRRCHQQSTCNIKTQRIKWLLTAYCSTCHTLQSTHNIRYSECAWAQFNVPLEM